MNLGEVILNAIQSVGYMELGLAMVFMVVCLYVFVIKGVPSKKKKKEKKEEDKPAE